MRSRPWLNGGLLALALTGVPGRASAHMASGFGPFYDGFAHPFLTPEYLLPVLAVTILAGLRGARAGRVLLFALSGAWLIGNAAGLVFAGPLSVPVLTSVLLVALGTLVAADTKLPLASVIGLAALVGLLHGDLNGAALREAGVGVQGLVGSVAAVFVTASLVGGQVAALRAQWARVAARVAGSWIAATGLLMLGWALRA